MLGTLIAFWRAHKSRSRITETLEPFLAQWRRDGGTDADLETPAALGFLTTLITTLAEREAGSLGSDALGNLQADAWTALTGLPPDNLGERIVGFSIAGDPRFARGCRAALLFNAVLASVRDGGLDGLGSTAGHDGGEELPAQLGVTPDLVTLWRRAMEGDTIHTSPLSEIS